MIRLRVPATTANLGPGIDTLGMALQLYVQLESEYAESGIEIVFSGLRDQSIMENSEDNLVYKAMKVVFKKARFTPTGLYLKIDNNIPIGKGLGSSAAAIVAGMYSANSLLGDKFAPEEIMRWAVSMEGHADNVVPAMTGGLTVAMIEAGEVYYQKINIGDELKIAVAVPDFTLPTNQSRSILPENVSLKDTISNLQKACYLLLSMQKGDFTHINKAMEDMIHQPLRKRFIPGFDQVISAALDAGALGAALSGAGPSILAFTSNGKNRDVGEAMQKAFRAEGVDSQILYLKPDNIGVQYY